MTRVLGSLVSIEGKALPILSTGSIFHAVASPVTFASAEFGTGTISVGFPSLRYRCVSILVIIAGVGPKFLIEKLTVGLYVPVASCPLGSNPPNCPLAGWTKR